MLAVKGARGGSGTRNPADADVRMRELLLPKHFYPILSRQFKGEVVPKTTPGNAAEALAFPPTIEQYSLAEVAPIIIPAEAIGDFGLEFPPDARMRLTRFEFWGAEPSLARLRASHNFDRISGLKSNFQD